jgi:hypothetical protein
MKRDLNVLVMDLVNFIAKRSKYAITTVEINWNDYYKGNESS